MQKTTIITIIVAMLFVLGTGTIMYYGRPVMQLENTQTSEQTAGTESEEAGESESEEAAENEEISLPETNTTTNTNTTTTPTVPTETTTPTTSQAPGTYTSAQVATHAVESDCWASVDSNVYDLTSWVSRHPGGSKAIISLCGIDATSKFEKVHGGSSAAKAALALLKIGTLAQ